MLKHCTFAAAPRTISALSGVGAPMFKTIVFSSGNGHV
jgi:hypothetical protein